MFLRKSLQRLFFFYAKNTNRIMRKKWQYGTQYAYYAAGNTPAKTRRTSTTKRRHWTRDTDPDNAVNFLYIDTTGAIASNKVTTSNMYVAFAFCF